jgi:hypothetical protein
MGQWNCHQREEDDGSQYKQKDLEDPDNVGSAHRSAPLTGILSWSAADFGRTTGYWEHSRGWYSGAQATFLLGVMGGAEVMRDTEARNRELGLHDPVRDESVDAGGVQGQLGHREHRGREGIGRDWRVMSYRNS